MFNNKFVSWAALLGLDIGILEFFLCSLEQSLLLGIWCLESFTFQIYRKMQNLKKLSCLDWKMMACFHCSQRKLFL